MNADVVVVGYGPSGGSLAYYLGREGLDVVVVDKRVGIWPLPRAGHVDDEIMRAWQGMGLAEELAPTLTEVPDYEYYRSDWSRYFTMPNSPGITDQGWPTHAFFNQPVFERALRRRVAKMPNVHLLLGATLTGIEDDEAGVTATLEDAESTKVAIHAAYLAGFDGANSTTRRLLGIELEETGEPQSWLVVMVRLHDESVPELPDRCFEWAGEERAVTYIAPLPDRIRLWEFRKLPGETNAELEDPARVWQLLDPWVKPEHGDLVRADVYTFRSAVAAKWRRGRCFIGGDAAHQMPPKAGQGLCAGFRDAANLGWKLAAALQRGAPDTLLDTYESERRPNVEVYIGFSQILTDAIDAAAAGTLPAGFDPSAPLPLPPLGPGLHGKAPAPAGTRSRQPRLTDGQLLDDVVGYRFAVLGRPDVLDGVSAETRAIWRAIDCAVVSDEGADVCAWLNELRAGAVLIRPDRFLVDAAADTTQLEHLTARLAEALGVSHTPRTEVAA